MHCDSLMAGHSSIENLMISILEKYKKCMVGTIKI